MPPSKSSSKKPAAAALTAPQPAAAPPSLPTNPDPIETYKALYDVLGRAYWEASDLNAKDTIQGARDAIYQILTDLNAAKLDANTTLFLQLKSKIEDSNKALEKIEKEISQITKNISTASSVVAAIAKVLSLAPSFA